MLSSLRLTYDALELHLDANVLELLAAGDDDGGLASNVLARGKEKETLGRRGGARAATRDVNLFRKTAFHIRQTNVDGRRWAERAAEPRLRTQRGQKGQEKHFRPHSSKEQREGARHRTAL